MNSDLYAICAVAVHFSIYPVYSLRDAINFLRDAINFFDIILGNFYMVPWACMFGAILHSHGYSFLFHYVFALRALRAELSSAL